jgi:hypothetical protein
MLNRSSRTAVQVANRLLVTPPRELWGCLLPRAVMGSAAKHLGAPHARCFAALSMTAPTAVQAAQVRSRGKSSLHMSIVLVVYSNAKVWKL